MKVLKLKSYFKIKLNNCLFSNNDFVNALNLEKFCTRSLKVKSFVVEKERHSLSSQQKENELEHTLLKKIFLKGEYLQYSGDLVGQYKPPIKYFYNKIKFKLAPEYFKITNEKFLKYKNSIEFFQMPKIPIVKDISEITLEIISGHGGPEAQILAKKLLEMYKKLMIYNGCEFKQRQVFDRYRYGYLKKASIICKPGNLYPLLKYEAGTHTMQRVDDLDKKIIKTSTAKVSVIKKDFLGIKNKDIKRKYVCAEPGKETEVILVHIPTGITVTNCETRVQFNNLYRAKNELANKVFQHAVKNIYADIRMFKITDSDKIRTYNFSRDEINDHRFELKTKQVDLYLNGGSHLYKFLEKQDEKLKIVSKS